MSGTEHEDLPAPDDRGAESGDASSAPQNEGTRQAAGDDADATSERPIPADDVPGSGPAEPSLPPIDDDEAEYPETASIAAEGHASDRRGAWRGICQADGLVEPARLIAELALEPILPLRLRRALRAERPLVVILTVPSAAWVKPVEAVIKTASENRARIVTKAVRSRGSAEADLDAEIVERISNGRPLVAITPDAGFLAPVLVAAADHNLVVAPFDAALVTRAIGLWCGRRPRIAATIEELSGLDLLDVAAALRTGAPPAACLDRIRRASRARVGVPVAATAPPLNQLTGYGEAQDWALRTVADIARVRRGEVSADVLESAVLFGPPGTGKTTLARALAAEANVAFTETSVGRWFADSPGFLDSIIKQISGFADTLEGAAKREGVSIGFIDELDALPSRARLDDRNASWWQPVVAHALTCTERLRRAGVVLIAATNHLDHIDPALLRPGRFDRLFLIAPPDEPGRLGILRAHLGDDLADADLIPAARLSAGMTGAILAGCVRGARGRARAAERDIVLDDLLAEIAPADPRAPAERHAVALHEAGHAVAALRLGLSVELVSIVAGNDYGGRTIVRLPDRMPDRAVLERRVVGLLAGRAADAVLGTGVTAGAASDLREATRQVAALHGSLGLGETLRAVVDPEHAAILLREDPLLAGRVESELRRLQGVAEGLVRSDRTAITALVEALLTRRVLTGDEVAAIVAVHRPRIRVASGRRRVVGTPGRLPNTDAMPP